ncbi:hypothetical protein CSPAE12_05579 [Colletotrichum incanum]|nr:hypothetical protein CSPAE12_05579 [Colletotrichum incanum]
MDAPCGWELAVGVLGEEVIFALYDDVRRHRPAICTHTLNDRNLFPIARLLCTRPFLTVRRCNNLCVRQHSHQEPSLIKIVDIIIKYSILRNCVLHKCKPALYNRRILS